jgi:DNA-binding transcriptional LysR family regulator
LAPPRTGLDANALELFARIVAAGSFAQAARELGLTRAAVSRRVAGIESALGASLFARTTRALGLTERGRRLAHRARAVLEAAEGARRALRRDAHVGLQGTLRVTCPPSFGQAVLAPLLAAFQREHPGVHYELRLTHRRMDLLRDDVDVAFRLTAKPPADWVAQTVMTFSVHAYAAPHAGVPLASPEALAGARCLLFGWPTEQIALSWSHDDGRRAAVTVEPVCVADDLGVLLTMASVGTGIVFAPDFVAANAVAGGALVDALPGWRLLMPEGNAMQALTLPQPDSPEAARLLVRYVRNKLRARAATS